MKENNVQGKSIIVGLGKTGLSVAKYMVANGLDFKILDTRSQPPMLNYFRTHFPDVEVETGKLDLNSLLGAKELIISPGLSLKTPEIQSAKSYGIPIRGDVDIFSQVVDAPIIGVTGSNGKSTVVAMLREILKKAGKRFGLGGNLDGAEAKPALDLLQGEAKELYVLELSSFQLETTTSLQAEVAVILNLSEDHMDRYETYDDYIASKHQVYNGAKHCIYNYDDRATKPKNIDASIHSFSVESIPSESNSISAYISSDQLGHQIMINDVAVVHTNRLSITGIHNWKNVLASLTILALHKLPFDKAVLSALESYKGLSHRFQLISRNQNCEWINDSKATNVGATIAAIESIVLEEQQQLILIAGGDSKGSDLSPLAPILLEKVDHLILLGVDAKKLAQQAPTKQAIFVDSMQQAVEKARELINQGDKVLLSPACSSLDMYANFEARGNAFAEAVRACA